jgi:predicted alpha/beta-hydrolase family hydrolase
MTYAFGTIVIPRPTARDDYPFASLRMTAAKWTIPVGNETTSAIFDPTPNGDTSTVFVCAHGAGGNMSDRAMVTVSRALGARGLSIVRFNFLYKEKRSSRPDPMPKLEDTTAAVVARVRAELEPKTLILGGRSMGGRAASMLAADGFDCSGLLLLAYPLHPPGKPDQLRDAHLPSIRIPVLCVNGTRDPFCTPELMEGVLRRVTGPWSMLWLEGADHSFRVLKSSGKTDAQVMTEVAEAAEKWVAATVRSS